MCISVVNIDFKDTEVHTQIESLKKQIEDCTVSYLSYLPYHMGHTISYRRYGPYYVATYGMVCQ